MKGIEKVCLEFVLRYYKPRTFNTQQAIQRFEKRNGLIRTNYRFYWYSGIAATILLCIVGSLYFYNPATKNDWIKLVAGNAIKTYVLPDSTQVTLSPQSSLCYKSFDFIHRKRQVQMLGKVYFSVKRDEKHPFEIYGGNSHITVLGTCFQVSEEKGIANVYVTSGKVLFAAKEEKEGIILTKGMEASLLPGNKLPELITAEGVNQTAWATGRFLFDKTPLSEVLRDLSDFYHVKLVSTNEDKQLSGEFATDSLDEIIDLVENVLQVKIYKK